MLAMLFFFAFNPHIRSLYSFLPSLPLFFFFLLFFFSTYFITFLAKKPIYLRPLSTTLHGPSRPSLSRLPPPPYLFYFFVFRVSQLAIFFLVYKHSPRRP